MHKRVVQGLLLASFALTAGMGLAANNQRAGSELPGQSVPPEVKFGRASLVLFQVSIFGVFKKQGSFSELSGALLIQNDTAQVKARIKTASAVMKSESDAALLKSATYFDAARFPEIEFRSLNFPRALLREGGQISGVLTVRGISQKQFFNLTLKPCKAEFAQTPWRCGFDVAGTLKRSDFGMKARRGIVSDDVELTLSIDSN